MFAFEDEEQDDSTFLFCTGLLHKETFHVVFDEIKHNAHESTTRVGISSSNQTTKTKDHL